MFSKMKLSIDSFVGSTEYLTMSFSLRISRDGALGSGKPASWTTAGNLAG
jgi:hypothetical protein